MDMMRGVILDMWQGLWHRPTSYYEDAIDNIGGQILERLDCTSQRTGAERNMQSLAPNTSRRHDQLPSDRNYSSSSTWHLHWSGLHNKDIPETSTPRHSVDLGDISFSCMHSVPVNLSTEACITPPVQLSLWSSGQEMCNVPPCQPC